MLTSSHLPDQALPPLYDASQIRALEQTHAGSGLMEKAGLAAATLARDLLGDDNSEILVLTGPGNNGGDALVAARHLLHWWYKVTVIFTSKREQLSADAAAAFDAWLAVGGTLHDSIPAGRYALVVDGLFGIGLQRPLEGHYAALVQQVNTLGTPVLALDIPSGLCADSGRVLGCAIQADHTLTFIGLKPGLYTLDGPDYAGAVHVCDLGIDQVADSLKQGRLLESVPTLPAPRRHNSHKGTYGSVGVLGGDAGMTGAALLTARAALHSGAGRVYCGLLAEQVPTVDPAQPELMLRNAKSLLDIDHLTALVAGPGLGRSGHAASLLQRALHYPAPLLVDADALHLIADDTELLRLLHARRHDTIATPHPGEAAALLDCSIAEIQSDRIAAACKIANKLNAATVLKGAGSIIALPDGNWYINTSGNPGLASAGMGDVLAGLVAGLAAQGAGAEESLLLGVYVHGRAADELVAHGTGPIGLTASEVTLAARELLNQWTCRT